MYVGKRGGGVAVLMIRYPCLCVCLKDMTFNLVIALKLLRFDLISNYGIPVFLSVELSHGKCFLTAV